MGSRDQHQGDRRHGVRNVVRIVSFGLLVASVVKELRTPAEERRWHGVVAGFVPYDLRRPTFARIRERMWDPQGRLLSPRAFGVGWTLNAGRVVQLVRTRISR
jgi:hypothetical protein